jgi:hypothetical protein
MSNQKLDDMMRKVSGLLAKADDPASTEEEADACRATAEKIMRKYRIEESMLIESGALTEEGHTPGSKVVVVCNSDSPYMNTYYAIMDYVTQHTGCRMAYNWGLDPEGGQYSLLATLVGYEADIRFSEALFMNARLIFADRMEPKPKPDLSDEDNVYRLRSSGMERIKIAKVMGWGDTGSATAKVTRLYKAACKARGEDPTLTGRSMSVTAFREAYATGFTAELYSRLYRARNAAGGGGELVLANRKETVDEAFYRLYPHKRPGKEPVKATKATKAYRWTAKDEARYRRANGAAGQAGSQAGKRAASEVDVSGRKRPGQLNNNQEG